MFNLKDPKAPLTSANRDKMHPEDLRNLFLFFILAGTLYFSYDAFMLQPQREALKAQRQQIAQTSVQAPEEKEAEKPVTRAEALAQQPHRVTFENPEIHGTINLKGARLDDLSLRNYFKTIEKKEEVHLLEPRGLKNFRAVEYGWTSADPALKVPGPETIWSVRGNAALTPQAPVTLFWDNGQGLVFEQTLSLDAHVMFTVAQRVINNSGKKVSLYPYGLVAQRGLPQGYEGVWVSYEGPIGYIGEALQHPGYPALRTEKKSEIVSATGWLGLSDKYWLTGLVPPQEAGTKYSFSFSGADEQDKDGKGLYQADFLGPVREIAPGARTEVTSHMYAGAKRVFWLEEYERNLGIPKFDLAVDFGWFWFMTKPFFFALHYLGLWIGNMGAAIIVLTIMIRGAVFPLTNISYRSFAKMKKVGPMVADLRHQYGDDKQKLQAELIELYQREGVNPMSGCFPILLQIPIFFALYKTFLVSIELRHAPFVGWIKDLTAIDPTSVFNLFGLIDWTPPGFLMIGVWPCLMLVAMLLQKQLNPPPQDPIQRDMALYMPFMFAYMMSHFPAGLVIYWTFSAYIGVAQQIIIMKSLGVPVHLFGETEDDKKLNEAIDQGPAVHPLAEMAEKEVEQAMFGGDEPEGKTISKPKPKKSKKKK